MTRRKRPVGNRYRSGAHPVNIKSNGSSRHILGEMSESRACAPASSVAVRGSAKTARIWLHRGSAPRVLHRTSRAEERRATHIGRSAAPTSTTPNHNAERPCERDARAFEAFRLEAAPGFEPGNKGFAVPRLTTWPCRLTKLVGRGLYQCRARTGKRAGRGCTGHASGVCRGRTRGPTGWTTADPRRLGPSLAGRTGQHRGTSSTHE